MRWYSVPMSHVLLLLNCDDAICVTLRPCPHENICFTQTFHKRLIRQAERERERERGNSSIRAHTIESSGDERVTRSLETIKVINNVWWRGASLPEDPDTPGTLTLCDIMTLCVSAGWCGHWHYVSLPGDWGSDQVTKYNARVISCPPPSHQSCQLAEHTWVWGLGDTSGYNWDHFNRNLLPQSDRSHWGRVSALRGQKGGRRLRRGSSETLIHVSAATGGSRWHGSN